jgi:ABC-2 type transport system ATP-binding protein
MTSAANAIDVRGLTKGFGGRTVVRGVDLNVRRGEIMGFLGPNGSGKTTTIRMLCGLLRPDSGEGSCLGFDIRRQTAQIKRQTGYMTQRFSFYEDLSIRENLEFVARLYALPGGRAAVETTLRQLGLERRADQLAGQLSGGWKQRLALAACVMHKPQLLLLDEPTAGVDPKARRDFWDEIHELAGEGLTVLVSTHYMDEAERCHHIVYLFDGRVMARGTVGEVIAAADLATFVVRGPDEGALTARLRRLPGVEQVTSFGSALHVVGRDRKVMTGALEALRTEDGISVVPGKTSLEDVFIHFLKGAGNSS